MSLEIRPASSTLLWLGLPIAFGLAGPSCGVDAESEDRLGEALGEMPAPKPTTANAMPCSGTAAPCLRGLIAGGDWSSVAVKLNELTYTWGTNGYGQLGNGGSTGDRSAAGQAFVGRGVVSVASGFFHAVALEADGSVWAWGQNAYGQCGNPPGNDQLTPAPVSGLGGVVDLSASGWQTIALKMDGSVWAFGYNAQGQLGDGGTANHWQPIQVVGLAGAVDVDAGLEHTLAVKADGTVWAWGNNALGQLGDGSGTAASYTPVQVLGLGGVQFVEAGNYFSLALKSDGTVWAWGQGSIGQLGDGTFTDRPTPVQVVGVGNVVDIVAGEMHALALKADGTVWTWGDNTYGQLGDNTNTNKGVPIQVPGLAGIVAIGAGSVHSFALKSDGTLWAWGLNNLGQLGDGTTANRLSPVQVVSFDLTPPPGPCDVGGMPICLGSGVCGFPPVVDGTACNDDDACTESDICASGVCVGQTSVVCTPLDQCHDPGTCDPATGLCSDPSKPDGASCDDGDACTQFDTCQSGACASQNPVVCVALDQCHDAGSCDAQSGLCDNPAKPDNSTCDDGDPCTQNDVCQSGTCTSGSPVVCMPLDECHDAGTCDPQTGLCTNPAKTDETSCSSGVCLGGNCMAAKPCNAGDEGALCTDGNACTVGDTCQSGACVPGSAKICPELPDCKVSICNPADGNCLTVPAPDQTPCTGGVCFAGQCINQQTGSGGGSASGSGSGGGTGGGGAGGGGAGTGGAAGASSGASSDTPIANGSPTLRGDGLSCTTSRSGDRGAFWLSLSALALLAARRRRVQMIQ